MNINSTIGCLQGRFLVAISLLLTTVFSVRADYKSTVLNDQPLAYYALDLTIDNSGTATDLSGNGNNSGYYNLSATAGPTAYIPNAALFTAGGVQSFVDLSSGPNATILNFGGTITMEAWVQTTNLTQSPADILGKGYDSSINDDELVLRASSGGYYGGTYNNNNGGANANGGTVTTNWTYLVSTYDGTNWNLYVNGQAVGHGADTVGAINFTDPWAIGTGSADGFSRFYQGTICQVALYTNALTPAQVLNHFYEAELNAPAATSVPIIVTQPQSQAGFINGSITFTVSTVSSLPTTNQWYKGTSPLIGQTNTTLTLNNLQLTNAGNYSVVVGSSNGTTNSAVAVLTVSSGNNLRWNDGGTSGIWDTGTTANWLNLANSTQTTFNAGDAVLFDDTPGVSTNININSSVSPSVVTVNSSTNVYAITNTSFPLTGPAALVKKGSSYLTIINGANFTGPATVAGGVVYAGNNCFRNVSSMLVTNNATLDFGGGTYNTGQPVTISGTGVNGEGALYNSYPDGPGEQFNITLAGDATIGCTSGSIWGLNGGSTITGPHKLTIKWGGSGDYTEWNGVIFAPNSGDFELASGKLGIKNMGSHFGNPASTFTVDSGAELDFWTSDFGYSKNYHVFGLYQILTGFTSFNGNVTLENGSQFNSFYGSGNETLGGTFTLNGNTHFVFGDANFIFPNVISGPGGFVWDAYNHEIIMQAVNTYSGPTVIGGGLTLALTGSGSVSHSSVIFFGGGTPSNVSLDASGRSDGTLTLASGQTLGGIGTVNGKLVVQSGAIIAPGGTNVILNMTEGSSATGTLSANNDVTLAGNTVMKLNGSGVSDEIVSTTKINYGGTLTVANISGAPYAVGNSFQLFSAPSLTGSFTISPATPGPGLAWDMSQLNSSGSLNVIAGNAGPVINSVKDVSGKLIFSGTGGTPSVNYVVYANTNLATTNWVPVMTNAFDGSGNFNVTNTINVSTHQIFYRIK